MNRADPRRIGQHFKKLEAEIVKYIPDYDKKLLKTAFEFSKKAHEGQKRASGAAFILHPLSTAINCTRLKLDLTSILVAILHDVVEDTDYDLESIRKVFGAEVTTLVDGLTKLRELEHGSDMTNIDVESYRKLFFSAGKDLRVILIKICDRLHNLRTLQFLSKEARFKMAKETLEIYQPIVHLLGIGEFMMEVEDLCFKYTNEEAYNDLYQKVGVQKDYYLKKIKSVSNDLSEILKSRKIKAEINGRIKSLYSIYKKIKIRNLPVTMIYDILAIRLICDSLEECYQILGIIHTLYKVKLDRFKDYISSPKNNGYQALHTSVFDEDRELIEFQILTKEMGELNQYGFASHFIYKNYNNLSYSKVPEWVKNIIELQKGFPDPVYYFDKLKNEVLSPIIECYTPKGDKIDLPKDSTILDFAYKIHSDLGNKFKGAYVNGQYIENPIHKLSFGDVVNIVKGRKIRTDYFVEYISILKTETAREKLKKIFKGSTGVKNKLGRFLLNEKLKLFGLRDLDEGSSNMKKQILTRFRFKSEEDLYRQIGTGSFDLNIIVNYLSNYFEDKKIIKKVNLKIFLKVREISNIYSIVDIFHNLNINFHRFKYGNNYIYLSFYLKSLSQLQKLLLELKRAPNVREVKRLFPKRLIAFYIIFGLFLILVLMIPFALKTLREIDLGPYDLISGNLLFFVIFMVMLMVMYIFKYVVMFTLPDRLNYKRFWLAMFILNTIILLTIFRDMVFRESYYNGLLFISVALVIYGILALEFVDYKLKNIEVSK